MTMDASTGTPEGGQQEGQQAPQNGPEPQKQGLDAFLEKLDDEGRQAVEGALRKAREDAAGYRKRLKDAEGPLAEYEKLVAASKTDAERAAEELAAAKERASSTTKRLVGAETRALAHEFADPTDAVHFLKPAEEYLDEHGEVAVDRIKADLAAVLKAKPHLAKAPERRGPVPDPSQGSGAAGADSQAGFARWLLGERA